VLPDRSVSPDQVVVEIERLEAAVLATDEQLAAVSRRLEAEHRSEAHDIVEAHRLMLQSEELVDDARRLISREHLAAETAVRRTVDRIVSMFDAMDDSYTRERGSDVEAVGERLLRTTLGRQPAPRAHAGSHGAIGLGFSLAAVDALDVPGTGLLGLVTERGGKTSHAAIILRSLEIPYVVGVSGLLDDVQPGDLVLMDGARGEVVISPDEETLAQFEERQRRQRAGAGTPALGDAAR
jgi:phosphotransferase system enzyme I (PtsI)